jgi:non-specific serine/threonine protein kinase
MEEMFDLAMPEIGAHEANLIKKLLRRILQFDSSKRPSPCEILLDPWFRVD